VSKALAVRIAIVAAIWTLLHLYVGLHVTAELAGAPRELVWAAVLGLAAAPFAAFVAARRGRLRVTPALDWVGYTAMGLSSLLIVFFLVTDLLRLPVSALTVVALAGVVTALGTLQARRPRVVRVSVPITDLPRDLEGFRIVQISDLHVGPTLKRRFVERVVATANALDPDVVAVTGDVADGFVSDLRDDVAPLAGLEAPDGKFVVTGNHEYYWDAPGWIGEVERLGLAVLNHAYRVVERGGARLVFAGVPDLSVPSDPATALRGAPTSDVRILLAHQPKSAFAARAAGFDLQLSGHTHGGQYFPFNLLVRLFQPFVAGLHRLEAMWLYVSRGTGYWGPPLRLGAPSEITLIELARA
jgi:predicted MPP superfamily phosphohydrolase